MLDRVGVEDRIDLIWVATDNQLTSFLLLQLITKVINKPKGYLID